MSRRFVDWLTRNWPYKLISVFIALFAWSWVQLEEVHEGQVRARVDWSLPTGLMSVEQLPTTVTLNLRGTGAAIRRARDTVVRLAVDVSTVGVGEHSVEFTSFPVSGLPNAVDVLGCSPAAMRFNLDEVTHRKVKLQAVMVGDPAAGHLVQSVALDPSVVGLVGPL